jgi:hypothetical protein
MSSASHAIQAEPAEAGRILAKATLAAARRLGLSNQDLAVVLGTSAASVSRLSRERGLHPGRADAALAVLFIRLFRSLDAATGGDEAKARAWFTAPNRHLGGVPADLVRSPEGLVNAVQYLDAIRGKL